ncbi:MAG: IPT/TIG domain-containing protein [Actinomycetota bacterium]
MVRKTILATAPGLALVLSLILLVLPGARAETWTQANSDGFGDANNDIAASMSVFGSYLYAGTTNSVTGCEVWRSAGGTAWTRVDPGAPGPGAGGFGDPNNWRATSMSAFGSYLYVGTYNASTGCEVWRSPDGTAWTQVNTDGFGDASNESALSMSVFGPHLYVGTGNDSTGCEVWRTDDGTTWTRVDPGAPGPGAGGFGDSNNWRVASMSAFGSYLYAGTWNASTGCEVWRSQDGTAWSQANSDGFGDPDNDSAATMSLFGTYLYAGTENGTYGCEVWRSPDGTTWTQVNTDGFGDANNDVAASMSVFGSGLYAGTHNGVDGCEVWKSPDGTAWTKANDDGFGDIFNASACSASVFDTHLYVGTDNGTGGGEVWSADPVTPPVVETNAPTGITQTGAVLNGDITATGGEDCDRRGFDYRETGAGSWTEWSETGTFSTGPYSRDLSGNLAPDTQYDFVAWAENSAGRGEGTVRQFTTPPWPVPHITGISPSSGYVDYTTVTIDGTDFGLQDDQSRVFFGAQQAYNTLSWSDTRIQVKVPYITGGTYEVWVETRGGGSNTRDFTVIYPEIESVSPGRASGKVSITVYGKNFITGGMVAVIGFEETQEIVKEATSVDVQSSTRLVAEFDLAGVPEKVYDLGVAPGIQSGAWGVLRGCFAVGARNTWYLAEGTTAWGFSTYISIQNPNPEPVDARVTYMTADGEVDGGVLGLPASSQTTITNDALLAVMGGPKDFSTKVEAMNGENIAVDRTMSWTGPTAASPEGHNSVGVTGPADTWYLPEGSANWGFESWLLIQNPNAQAVTCDVTYMIEGEGPHIVQHAVPASGRASFSMQDDIGHKDASIQVECDLPVIPERAMYRYDRREGHCSIGTTTPSTSYYLAEGATGYDCCFVTYILVQNPQETSTDVSVTYLTATGEVAGPSFTMLPNSRKTVRVNDQLQPNTDVSTTVTGSSPIIAERAMYWTTPSGEACHDSIGIDAARRAFFLPDGQTSEGRETWTLVANPNDGAVKVRVTYLTPTGDGNTSFEQDIGPNSRMTFDMAQKYADGRASVMVESLTPGRKIMCERAMYWNSRGAGTDTIGGCLD